MTQGHTPGPWRLTAVKRNLDTKYYHVNSYAREDFTPLICTVDFGAQKMSDKASKEINEANAAFIVKAVNSHYELLAIAKALVSNFDNPNIPAGFIPNLINAARVIIDKTEKTNEH